MLLKLQSIANKGRNYFGVSAQLHKQLDKSFPQMLLTINMLIGPMQ